MDQRNGFNVLSQIHAETYIQKMQKQPSIERRIARDEKHVGILRKDRFNITTPLDKTRNIRIKRNDA